MVRCSSRGWSRGAASFHQRSKWAPPRRRRRAPARRRSRAARRRRPRCRGAGRGARAPHVVEQPAVVGPELVVGSQSPSTRACRRNRSRETTGSMRAVLHLPLGDDRDAVQGDPLEGHDAAALLAPSAARCRCAASRCPPTASTCSGSICATPPGVEPVGLHQLGRDDQGGGFLASGRAGRDDEAGAARAEVLALLLPCSPTWLQQPGEQGRSSPSAGSPAPSTSQLQLARDPPELAVQVLPLADPQVVEELLACTAAGKRWRTAPSAAPAGAATGAARRAGPTSGRRSGRAASAASSCLSSGRSRGSWMDSAATMTSTSRTQPSRPASTTIRPIRGSTGSCASWRPTVVSPVVQGAELLEQRHAVAHVAPVRRLDEGELLDVAQAQRGHLQQHRGEVGAQDLGLGELRAGEEVLLAVQADADAVGDAPAAAGALGRRRLADRLDGQPLHLGPVAVAGDARGAGVDDVPDAGHRQGGLGDVGREHDAPATVCAAKTRCCSAADSRPYSGTTSAVDRPAQRVGGVPDLPLALTGTPARRPGPRGSSSQAATMPRSGPGPPPAGGSGPRPGRCGRSPRGPARRRSAG